MRALLVMLGGAVGAPARYLVDRLVQVRHDSVFPWGTMSVNVIGSVALGLIIALASPDLQLLLGTGLCGALTTYSTFSYETVRLYENRARFLAVANVAVSVLAGVGGALVGAGFGRAIAG